MNVEKCKLNQQFTVSLCNLTQSLMSIESVILPVRDAFTPEENPNNISLYILREDLRHPIISGNKWHKIRYHIEHAIEQEKTQLLSFGGAYSNLLHALAYCAENIGLQSIGVIRGGEKQTPTMQKIQQWGMHIEKVSRLEYKKRHNLDYAMQWQAKYPNAHIIPEGGGGELGLKGCVEWGQQLGSQIKNQFDVVAIAAGTGVSAAGLTLGLNTVHEQKLEAFVVHHDTEIAERNRQFAQNVKSTNEINNVNYIYDYAGKGFAKQSDALHQFVKNWNQDFELDRVYTSKLFYGVVDRINHGVYSPNAKVLVIHTGGLQGNV